MCPACSSELARGSADQGLLLVNACVPWPAGMLTVVPGRWLSTARIQMQTSKKTSSRSTEPPRRRRAAQAPQDAIDDDSFESGSDGISLRSPARDFLKDTLLKHSSDSLKFSFGAEQ
ncbi:unnamed protein product [Lampetra fluviatilis]